MILKRWPKRKAPGFKFQPALLRELHFVRTKQEEAETLESIPMNSWLNVQKEIKDPDSKAFF